MRMKHCEVKTIRFDGKSVVVEFALTHPTLNGLTVLVTQTKGGALEDRIRRAQASLYAALMETAEGIQHGYLIED